MQLQLGERGHIRLRHTPHKIVDVSVPHVEELMEVSKDFAQDRVQRCFAELTIENLAILLAVKILEAPVIQTHEKTQHLANTHVQHVVNTVEVEEPKFSQLVNTHVQHVVNTVEVEEPKLIKETVQRKKPIVQEKINQVTKHIDVPQVQFIDKVDDMPVVVQRQVYMTPEIQIVQGAQTSENLGSALTRQLAQAETVEVVEIGDAVEDVQGVFSIVMQRSVPTAQTVLKGHSFLSVSHLFFDFVHKFFCVTAHDEILGIFFLGNALTQVSPFYRESALRTLQECAFLPRRDSSR